MVKNGKWKIGFLALVFIGFVVLMNFLLITKPCSAKKESAEIYFTETNTEDAFDKNNQITEGIYGKSFNIVGTGFSKSDTVQVYLDEEYIGDKPIENGQFIGQLNIPKETEAKTHIVRVEGEARGETLETEISMKMPPAIPSWFLILAGLLIIGGFVYFIYRRMFQE